MTIMVQLEGATRWFGSGHTEVVALHPTNLTVNVGELVGGLDRPSRGRVIVAGQDVGALDPRGLAVLRRRSVGYVFQDLNLLNGLTARENVSLPLELDGRPLAEARAAAAEVLASVGLADLGDRYPDDLSGGEQQRVAIARALVGGRRVLLADEPTGALDSITGESVMRLLRAHCDQGGTGILVTHDAAHAAWADRVVFLRDGRIVDESRRAASPYSPDVFVPVVTATGSAPR
ncbi:MAG TPA: ATP-binding cassette domain-containing protein [Candidatus Limnocylindrales bacterium]